LKRTVAISLIAIIFLQLAGGPGIALAFNTNNVVTPHYTKGTHCSKYQQTDLFNFSQFLEIEDIEEDTAKNVAFFTTEQLFTYDYLPLFSSDNKHFLIHFVSAIKDRLPDRNILYCSFLI
jgi:hypothetical protein